MHIIFSGGGYLLQAPKITKSNLRAYIKVFKVFKVFICIK